MSELMTQAAYAASKKVSRQAINKLVKQGKLVLIEGKIDPAVADALLLERVDPARSKTAAGLAGQDDKTPAPKRESDASRFYRAKADREEAEAERAQLELEKLRGDLLEREPIERALFEAGRMFRDQVLNVPKRIAGDLAAMTDAAAIEERLVAELRRALAEFTKLATASIGEASN